MNWLKNSKIFKGIKGRIRFLEPLRNHTTFKIGGPAKIFIEPKGLNDLKFLLKLVKIYKIPFFLLGRGSNILISDKGLNAIVLKLNASYFRRASFKNGFLAIGSGALLNRLVLFAKEQGLAGAEFLAGIPGTVGGALAMNAGITERARNQKIKVRSISDLVKDITVMDYDGNIKTLNKKDIIFDYRRSNLSGYVILAARLRLVKGDKKQIKNKINAYLKYRKLTQDLSKPSAGCVFKNPAGYSAGRLIDLCGLKGKKIKDACVSQKHANFILNLKRANARDVLKLMDLIKKRVNSRFSLKLQPEIKIWQ